MRKRLFYSRRVTQPTDPIYHTQKLWEFGVISSPGVLSHPLPNVMQQYEQLKLKTNYPKGILGAQRAGFLYELYNNNGRFNWEKYRMANFCMTKLWDWFITEQKYPGEWLTKRARGKDARSYAYGFQDLSIIGRSTAFPGKDLSEVSKILDTRARVKKTKKSSTAVKPTSTATPAPVAQQGSKAGFKKVTAGGLHVENIDNWGQSGVLIAKLKEWPGPVIYFDSGAVQAPVGNFSEAELQLVPDNGIQTTVAMHQAVKYITPTGTKAVGIITLMPGRNGLTSNDEVVVQSASPTDYFRAETHKIKLNSLEGDATLEELYQYRDSVRQPKWQTPTVVSTQIVVPVQRVGGQMVKP